jgi:hypothetical protein
MNKEQEIEYMKDLEFYYRIKNAIKEVRECRGKWIRENLQANLNPLFTKQKDGSECLSFGVDSCYQLQFSFQNTERYNKKDIIEELKELLSLHEFYHLNKNI